MHRNRVIDRSMLRSGCAVAALAALTALAGCSTVRTHWPFAQHASAPPQAVAELAVGLPEEGAPPVVLQYWERNTLVVDLTNVPSHGHITLQPGAGRSWPVRIAFRMAPHRFQELEVRGAQRVLLPVAAEGTAPVTAPLSPRIYDAATTQLIVSWGATGEF